MTPADVIPLSEPYIGGNEWAYIKECLDTGWVSTAGKFVDRFEQAIVDYTGAGHAVSCVNGTAAIQTALLVAGVNAGDLVLVPTVTFIAPINAVRYLNAEPVFFDCDEFYNIDEEAVVRFIREETEARDGSVFCKTTGRRIAAAIPVNIFGNATRLEQLVPLCRESGIVVIEDATEALGTRYADGAFEGRHAGTVGDIGCLSFNGNKIITTGGGGMLITDNDDYADRARYLTTQAKDDGLRYVHNEVGYNFRLTNVQAAMGVAQLEQLPSFIDKKKELFAIYTEMLSGQDGLTVAQPPEYGDNNLWMYALQVDEQACGESRDALMSRLCDQGIMVRPLWFLNHLQVPYRDCRTYDIDRALVLVENTLNLPCSVGLEPEKAKRVAEVIING